MKKLTVVVITILGMALAFYGCNSFTAKPHTKIYNDSKNLLDDYEQALNKATNCEEVLDADSVFLMKASSLFEEDIDEDEQLTDEEYRELIDQSNRLQNKRNQLWEQLNCPTEDNLLELWIDETNKNLPTEYGEGVTITELVREGDYVVYYYVFDENLYDLDQLKKNIPALKSEWLKELNSDDESVTMLREIWKNAGVGVGYVYIGNKSGKKFSINIPVSELK